MKMKTASSSGSGTLPGNTITNPKEDLKGITTRSGTAYQGPMIPTTSYSLSQVVEHETEASKDMVHPTNNGSTKDVQPLVVQTECLILNYEPVVTPVKVDAFLALENDPTSPEVDQSYVDTKGDILLLEAFLNDDPSLPLQNQGNYLPQVQKELKICEVKTDKSSIDEHLEIKSSKGVYMARKPLTFLRLATMDPPRDIMAQIKLPRRCLTLDSIGPPSTVMRKT
nr:reverse transcriptase domain-containing protein [Tanacetum cinerariifolium]